MLIDQLERRILTRAFRGELVPQDPADEPAEALLARLRDQASPPTRTRRGRPAAQPVPPPAPMPSPPAEATPAPLPASATAATLARPIDPAEGPRAEADETEMACAVRAAFADGLLRPRDQALRDLAHSLGHRRLGARIEARMNGALIMAVRRRILENTGDGLRLATRGIADYAKDDLQAQFLASLGGRAWTEREAAIQGFARWLGFARTGPVIAETAEATIRSLLRQGRLERDGDMIRRG